MEWRKEQGVALQGFRSKSELCEVPKTPDIVVCRSLPPDVGGNLNQADFALGLNEFLQIRTTGLSPTWAAKQDRKYGFGPTLNLFEGYLVVNPPTRLIAESPASLLAVIRGADLEHAKEYQ